MRNVPIPMKRIHGKRIKRNQCLMVAGSGGCDDVGYSDPSA
jgi:hypothetical protein